jgi:hypothetical protein
VRGLLRRSAENRRGVQAGEELAGRGDAQQVTCRRTPTCAVEACAIGAEVIAERRRVGNCLPKNARGWGETHAACWARARVEGFALVKGHADLENHLDRYLELRRALGFEMRIESRLLRDFLAFLQGRTLAERMMAQAAIEWASSRGGL